MSWQELDGESFYIYAMELFFKAGHVVSSVPEIINHSLEQFSYFDNVSDVALSRHQRAMFRACNNVSRLFSYNGCVFVSLNLQTTRSERSQVAHDIHTMIHPLIGTNGTILISRYADEVMLSLMGFGYRCILSEWYPLVDDFERLLERLDIANMSIERSVDYFTDMVHILARDYYLCGQPSAYEILPIDFISSTETDRVDREELDEFIKSVLSAPQREYGDDYVEYDDSIAVKQDNISAELDLMLLEMDDEDNNLFGEEIASEDDILDEDELFDDNSEAAETDEYEFDDIDPEVFRDPTLMVKWLNKMDGNK